MASSTRTLLVAVLLAALLPRLAPAQNDAFRAALSRAREAARTGRLDDARQAFEQAAEAAPTDRERARTFFELASFLECQGHLHTSLDALEKLLAIQPPTPWHAPALERIASLYQRSGELEKALSAYERLAALPGLEPGMAQQALAGQVQMLRQMGRQEQAARVAQELLAELPDSPLAHQMVYQVVEWQLERGDFGQARKLAEAAAAREGGDPGILLVVAARMQEAGKLRDALELAERYVALRPADPSGHHMVYTIHEQRGTLGAYEQQLIAATHDPGNEAQALRQLADFYTRAARPADALRTLERLVAITPDKPELHAEAGRLAASLGQSEQAVQHYERAVQLSPDSAHLRSELGDLYATLGNREKALAAWKQAFAYSPTNLQSARLLGKNLHARGYYQDAVNVYLEARAATGRKTALAAELGEAYESMLFLDKAVAEYLAVLAADPANSGYVEARLQMLAMDEVARSEMISALESARGRGGLPDGACLPLGLAYLKSGDMPRARQAFEAIADPLQRASALYQVAEQLVTIGDRDAAISLLEMALASSQDVQAAGTVAGLAALRLARLYLETGDWQRAQQVLAHTDAGAQSPDLAHELRLALADILVLHAGDYTRAAQLYLAVMAETVREEVQRRAAWGLADCAFVAGKYAEAAKAYQNLMQLGPDPQPPAPPMGQPYTPLPAALAEPTVTAPPRPMGIAYGAYQLAEIQFRSGNFQEAQRQFERLALQYPESSFANDALARALLIKAEFTGQSPAEQKYVEALRLADQGQVDKAAAALQAIISRGPEEPLADDAALLYADTLARFGRAQEALAEYKRFVEHYPDSPRVCEAYLGAARLAARGAAGREEALSLYRALLAKYPDSPEAAVAELGLDDLLRKPCPRE